MRQVSAHFDRAFPFLKTRVLLFDSPGQFDNGDFFTSMLTLELYVITSCISKAAVNVLQAIIMSDNADTTWKMRTRFIKYIFDITMQIYNTITPFPTVKENNLLMIMRIFASHMLV